MPALSGQYAVVTGASSAIGKAIAQALGAREAHLCLVGRRRDVLEAVAASPPMCGSQVVCYTADLESEEDLAGLIDSLRRDVPSVDILAHAAGVMVWGPVGTASSAQLDSAYRTNLRAPYVLTQGLLPQLIAAKGQVAFVNSTAGMEARAHVSQYAASKHGLEALADSLREEVNPAGARVLSLYLGRTASDMQAAVHAAEGRAYGPELLLQSGEVADVLAFAFAAPRTVELTDIRLRPWRSRTEAPPPGPRALSSARLDAPEVTFALGLAPEPFFPLHA